MFNQISIPCVTLRQKSEFALIVDCRLAHMMRLHLVAFEVIFIMNWRSFNSRFTWSFCLRGSLIVLSVSVYLSVFRYSLVGYTCNYKNYAYRPKLGGADDSQCRARRQTDTARHTYNKQTREQPDRQWYNTCGEAGRWASTRCCSENPCCRRLVMCIAYKTTQNRF